MNKRTWMFIARAACRAASIATVCVVGSGAVSGCVEQEKPYGVERQAFYQPVARKREIWAIAPAVNLSGYKDVDALLQADILYGQLQQVRGLTIVPVNRVVEVCAALHIDKVQSQEQADAICEALGCDALLVPTVTAYDAYNPPKVGASLQLLTRTRANSSADGVATETRSPVVQCVGMYDASNGSVRDALKLYATGRNDPVGPMGTKEYLVSMDRYCGFVYHELIVDLLNGASRRKA